MTVALPAGWERWPPEAKLVLRDRLLQVAMGTHVPWECDRPGCDGRPHDGWPGAHSRADQRPPAGDWLTWLLLGGRGSGKTRTGAGWVHTHGIHLHRRGALIAPTAGDARDVMVEGESGILATAPPGQLPKYEPSKRRLTWPNGATASLYSADEPDRLRGPQHGWAWCDELAAWNRLQEAWDLFLMGMRLGSQPRIVATTTPRPRPVVRALVTDPTCHVTASSTYANLDNLAPTFREQVLRRYEGTRMGRQELLGELLLDTPGALWTWEQFDRPGFRLDPRLESTAEIVAALPTGCVAVDPAVTSTEDSDGSGIVAVAADAHRGVVLASREVRLSPLLTMRAAIDMALECDLDAVVVERNNGGDYLTAVARQVAAEHPDPRARALRITTVVATRGKAVRAQPVAGLYEQQKVQHLGTHPALEQQLTSWVDDPRQPSPNLLDALVWAVTWLMVGRRNVAPARAVSS